jgi:hypothetical protein
LPCEAYAATLPGDDGWVPGAELDLGERFAGASPVTWRVDEYLSRLRGAASNFGGGFNLPDGPRDVSDALKALTFYSMLTPPAPIESTNTVVAARRALTHTLDLSRWFTQPCVIIVGEVEDSRLPTPIRVDADSGDVMQKSVTGRTMVRWVYPLAPRPLRAQAPRSTPEDALPEQPGGAGP